MAELSWSGVQLLAEALSKPRKRASIIASLTQREGVRQSTASSWLSGALRLDIVAEGAGGLLSLNQKTGASSLLASPLVRLMSVARQLGLSPRAISSGGRSLREAPHAGQQLGIRSASEVRAAWRLSRHGNYASPIPLRAALVLAFAEVRSAHQVSGSGEPWDAAVAHTLINQFLRCPAASQPALSAEAFTQACQILHARGLLRMVSVQHAVDAHAPYRPFASPLGYIKSLLPPSTRKLHAKPISFIGQRLLPTL